MLIARAALRIADASTTAHLDKVEHGYENMDHFSVEFRKESRALCSIDFIQGQIPRHNQSNKLKNIYRAFNCLAFLSLDDEDEDEEDSEAGADGTEAAQAGSGGAAATAVQTSDLQPSNSSQSPTQSASSS